MDISLHSALAILAGLILASSPAAACQVDFVDEFGQLTLEPPTQDDNIASSDRVFVGTVQGWRTYDGTLLEQSIDCWDDASYSEERCDELLASVISVVLSVDHAITGIEPGRLYEELYGAGDGDCGPYFQFGKRYIYTNAIFGVDELPEEPTPQQLAHWASLIEPRAPEVDDNPRPLCEPSDESTVIADLASSNDAFVGRVTSVRTDDASTVTDVSACRMPDSAACQALEDRVISIQVDVQASVKGDTGPGHHEIGFWSCPLPPIGQTYLLGGSWDGWYNLDHPRLLLSAPPSEADIEGWRLAGLGVNPAEVQHAPLTGDAAREALLGCWNIKDEAGESICFDANGTLRAREAGTEDVFNAGTFSLDDEKLHLAWNVGYGWIWSRGPATISCSVMLAPEQIVGLYDCSSDARDIQLYR